VPVQPLRRRPSRDPSPPVRVERAAESTATGTGWPVSESESAFDKHVGMLKGASHGARGALLAHVM
jgi:hypothetical protein